MKGTTLFFVSNAFILLLFAATSCNKGGIDGDATITGKVAHHEKRIPNATVFIGFGDKEFPGNLATDFDMSTVADTAGNYTFANLKKGNYYLYSVGYDSLISSVVTGGIGVVKLLKDEVRTVEVAVTE